MKFDIRQLTETASTNDDAKKAAESGAPEGTVIWALRQSAGRGRQGRQWSSPEGNLYCSVVLRPTGGLPEYGFYSFIAALAIFDAVHSFLPDADIKLKWPNDVLVSGKKISGILLESGQDYLVIGIGLNVLYHPDNALYPTTSLKAEMSIKNNRTYLNTSSDANDPSQPVFGGRGVFPHYQQAQNMERGEVGDTKSEFVPPTSPSPTSGFAESSCPPSPPEDGLRGNCQPALVRTESLESVLNSFLVTLDHWVETFKTQGFAPIRQTWCDRARKGAMHVRLPSGEIHGEFADLDEKGNLRLLLGDGTTQSINAGDIFF